uniref:RxLR effector candidate protein n=1 Tax=Peronospora matthiolae TaxID=2874970 RepID=A0AAV1VDH1_9STRA
MRLSCLSATFISLGLLASVNPASCVAVRKIVAPGARALKHTTAKRMLRDDGKEQENRAAPIDVNADELFNIATRLAPAALESLETNLRGIPAVLSRSSETRFPFELYDAFQRELAKFRILLNSEQDTPPEAVFNLYSISVAFIASLRPRFAAGHFFEMSQIEADIMKVDVLTNYLSESNLAIMAHMSLDSSDARDIASRIQQALFIKWYRNSETLEAVEEKLKDGRTEDRLARVIAEPYIHFHAMRSRQLLEGA